MAKDKALTTDELLLEIIQRQAEMMQAIQGHGELLGEIKQKVEELDMLDWDMTDAEV